MVHNQFSLFPLGANTDEQPRPTEQMNGVLHDEDLPPQVIKRYERKEVYRYPYLPASVKLGEWFCYSG